MSPHRSNLALPDRLWRPVAWLAAGLVLLLSAASVSPALHAWLHEPEAESAAPHTCAHHGEPSVPDHAPDTPAPERGADHGCAISLFSHGVVTLGGALTAQPCEGILRAVNHRAFERLALAQPRYLHRPPQAPPAV